MTVTVATLGFPRIGPRREMKTALDAPSSGKTDAATQLATAADIAPSDDVALFDQVLDATVTVGGVAASDGWKGRWTSRLSELTPATEKMVATAQAARATAA